MVSLETRKIMLGLCDHVDKLRTGVMRWVGNDFSLIKGLSNARDDFAVMVLNTCLSERVSDPRPMKF